MATLVACGDKEQTNVESRIMIKSSETNEASEAIMPVEPKTEDIKTGHMNLELYSSRSGIITYHDQDNFFSKCAG